MTVLGHRHQFAGFTLIELMVVVMIVAVLATVAVPSYRSMMASMNQQSALSAVVDAIDSARSEAITRGQTIALCLSGGGDSCSSGNAWQNGFLVQASISQENYRIWPSLAEGISVFTIGLSNSAKLLFAPDGTALSEGTFVICSAGASQAAAGVVVNLSGMSRLAVDSADDDGDVVEDHAGDDLTCPT